MTNHFPTFKQSIVLLVSIILFQVALVFIASFLLIAAGMLDMNHVADIIKKFPFLIGILNLLAISPAIFWGYKKTQTPFTKVFPFQPAPGRVFIPTALILIGLSILLSELDNLLHIILKMPVDPNDALQQLVNSGSIWSAVFALVIVAPFTEEFLFRGLLLTGFLNNYSVKKAIWITALLFGIFHLNIFQIPGAIIIGLYFAWLTVKTKSLWPSLLGHALANSLPIIIGQILKIQILGYTVQNNDRIAMQPLWFDGIGLALVVFGIVLARPAGLWPSPVSTIVASPEPAPEPIKTEPIPVSGTESNTD